MHSIERIRLVALIAALGPILAECGLPELEPDHSPPAQPLMDDRIALDESSKLRPRRPLQRTFNRPAAERHDGEARVFNGDRLAAAEAKRARKNAHRLKCAR